MTIKVAINGFGRIGRNILRAVFENNYKDIEIVAINDLADLETSSHLLKYDSVHGKFDGEVKADNKQINIKTADRNAEIAYFCERNPEDLPWKELGVDVVMECTGIFRSNETAGKHITAGAKKVLISAPGSDVDYTTVFGVNHEGLTANHTIVSNASCTTNCLAPVAKVINDKVGIEQGLMTTIHAYTGDQPVLDVAHKDLRRARAAAMSMVPTSTGAAKAVGLVLPELAGKLDGFAVRVPTPNVSVVDLTFTVKNPTSVEEINNSVKAAAEAELKGILEYTDEPLVSIDMNHNEHSSIFDSSQTRVMEGGKLVKIMSWYDNEWGFSNRMLDTTMYWAKL